MMTKTKISKLVLKFKARPDYHQLISYGKVMETIGWKVVPLTGANLFVKPIGPLSFAKLQRFSQVKIRELLAAQTKYRIVRLHLEPGLNASLAGLQSAGFLPTNTHYAYTKTLIVDLSGSEAEILSSFSKTASYQMRRSLKTKVTYEVIPFAQLDEGLKQEILDLHRQWSREKRIAGYDDPFMRAMWQHMQGEGSMILARLDGQLHGALFFLTHHKVGLYFYQFTSWQARGGLYIPSGLAYQAIKLAKTKKCDIFDLCSAFDERYPKENLSWKGFTTHKEHFHPTSIYYPPAYARTSLSFFRVK